MSESYEVKLFEEIEEHKNSIFVLQHELEVMVPQHTHSQGHILVVMNGVATMNVERNAYYIPYGYFVWIPPGVSHRISFEGKKIKLLNIYYPPIEEEIPFYQEVGVYPTPSLLYHTFEQVQEHTTVYLSDDWHYELLMTLKHILPHIIKKVVVQLRLPTTNHPIVLRILDTIHQKYQSQITAQSISQDIGLSVRTLSRYLRNELDTTFIQYVQTYRIIMAIKEIVKNEESITNIAYNVGYESLTAFSNTFYKITGYRPSQFLKQE